MPTSSHFAADHRGDFDETPPEAVRAELRKIVESRHFRSSKRSQQFLEYVVDQKLRGNAELIKERTIGVEVFGRDANYATGDDPVVRVQASDVRRRLDAYRMDQQSDGPVAIELPTGTYVPAFRSRLPTEETGSAPEMKGALPSESVPPEPHERSATGMRSSFRSSLVSSRLPVTSFIRAAVLLAIGAAAGYVLHLPAQPPKPIRQFWGPLLSSDKTVVISLGKPAVYVPTRHLFDLFDAEHPGAFDRVDDRHNNFLALDKRTPILWGDLTPVQLSGPAEEGVRSGLAIALFLGRAGKSFNARFGDEGAFADLRDVPSIIVGNLNNHWTSDLESKLPLRFRQTQSGEDIIEAGTDRSWGIESSGEVVRDYGIITREPNGITGSFLLKLAGIRGGGTEAASELVTNPEMLQGAISRLPANWENKNVQILVMAQVIGRKASSPQVVAVHVW